MKVRHLMVPLLAAGVIALGAGITQADEQSKWLKKAELGQFAPKKQDWKAIEAAARKEGKVVIYSVSSRIFKLQKKFKKKFGVEVVGHDIQSSIQLEKFRREHKAKIYVVDVLFNNATPLLLNEFLPRKMIWNFVPDSVAGTLDKSEKEPFLVQRWSSRVLFYNGTKHPGGAPIDSLWDLTREEWKGKFLMPNPLESSVQANVIQTILAHPKEMAAEYERKFGKPITYSKKLKKATKKNPLLGKPDAGKEWLYRMLQNKPTFQRSTTKIFKNIGSVKQKNPPVGFTTFSKIRKNKKGVLDARPAYNVKPVFGVSYPTVLVIADRAPHPNAAKLLVRYMMEKGFKYWNVHGDYAARSDVAKKQVKKFGIPPFESLKMWPIDQEAVYDNKYTYLSLFLALK